jgi:hypothetical protein
MVRKPWISEEPAAAPLLAWLLEVRADLSELDVDRLLKELGLHARPDATVPLEGDTKVIAVLGPPTVREKAAAHPSVVALFPDSSLTLY